MCLDVRNLNSSFHTIPTVKIVLQMMDLKKLNCSPLESFFLTKHHSPPFMREFQEAWVDLHLVQLHVCTGVKSVLHTQVNICPWLHEIGQNVSG